MGLRVDPELDDDLKTKAIAQPAGLDQEEEKMIQEGDQPGLPSLKRKKKEPASAAPEDADAVLIRRLKQEALALLDKGRKPEEDDARPPARKRKKYIKKRLPQGLIDYMIKRPCNSIYDIPPEKLAQHRKEFRESYLHRKAVADKVFEYEQVLINQYLTKGYADDEVEVTDDEDEE